MFVYVQYFGRVNLVLHRNSQRNFATEKTVHLMQEASIHNDMIV